MPQTSQSWLSLGSTNGPASPAVQGTPKGMSRRGFLGLSAAALAVPVTGAWASVSPLAGASGLHALQPRKLSFVHTHVDESLSVTYFNQGGYVTEGLSRLNHLLRDFRTQDVHPIDPRLFDVLYDLQVLADRDASYEIISGYRSPRTNAMLRNRSTGVATRSLHMDGKAIDVRLSGFPCKKLRNLALSMQRGGVGFYATSDFVHLDTGRVRSW